ncbi:OmpA family protein [Algibacter amylolyticus]|uniref:OmpA family protein n=1 Tax=Algibacter amylolyticus TaxID=1608400 RepID=A0A5M7BEY1_9FLAO|nr:OmpA family protein [Algibacter amylolyticus]KAA5827563.1 OmpA family protein [Algibacter amylolyticus]MBB5266769.1 outer membrane protein OmpA-like peptidoglycan-associated protein [Algibacter amylolyticus]TSJ81808.1 OmpA family protein [Algibacter amylolyticus]
MSKKSSYLLGIILTIILGTILYYFLCCSVCCGKESCKNKVDETKSVITPEIKDATKNAFVLKDANGDFNLNLRENFNFKSSNFSILQPVSTNIENGVVMLKDYLLTNPLKTVDITGFYKSDETNNSAYPNLGIARANSVKNYLVLHGISSKQIDTYGKLNDGINADESKTLFGPVEFGVATADASDTSAIEALKTACDAIRANPLVLHFKTGQASINLTPEQRQKIADISHCVDKLGVEIQVVGHTDNIGDATNNIVLGQQRADFAKGYLVKNGILEGNIETSSKGPNLPIADNATEAGRAENRRTEITIN